MALVGKYEIVRNEGMEEYLTANGMPADRIKGILEDSNKLDISINGDNISITRSSGRSQNLINNKEVTEPLPDGNKIKSVAALNGNTLSIESNGDRGSWKRVYVLSGSELVVTAVSGKPGVADGKRYYKKI